MLRRIMYHLAPSLVVVTGAVIIIGAVELASQVPQLSGVIGIAILGTIILGVALANGRSDHELAEAVAGAVVAKLQADAGNLWRCPETIQGRGRTIRCVLTEGHVGDCAASIKELEQAGYSLRPF